MVIFDQAYFEFAADAPDFADGWHCVRTNPILSSRARSAKLMAWRAAHRVFA
jgi:hypothetical protein